jgi:hypothetical protein
MKKAHTIFSKIIIKMKNFIFSGSKYTYSTIAIVALVAYSFVVYAAQLPNGTPPPSGGYLAGDSILDPGCAPGATDCFQNMPSGGSAIWGSITGTLSNQTDLQNALNNKWSLTGNAGTTAGTNFVGTTDAQALVFKTNSTEAMRILANGKVGIGTSTPITTFEDIG